VERAGRCRGLAGGVAKGGGRRQPGPTGHEPGDGGDRGGGAGAWHRLGGVGRAGEASGWAEVTAREAVGGALGEAAARAGGGGRMSE
jgi:hypothetical protein